MSDETRQETFTEFKNSFAYGSRTDLSFKFLKALSDEEAATFIRELFRKLGELFTDGDLGRLIDHVVAGQIQAYKWPTQWQYDEGSLTPLARPVNRTRLGLLSSTGHFVEGADPEPFGIQNMTQAEAIVRINEFLRATPKLSEIPVDTPHARLRVRHGGYDIRGAQADPNVAFPINRLRELAEAGIIGQFASPAYSFVGAAAQRRLMKEAIPAWLTLFRQRSIEAAVLVPV